MVRASHETQEVMIVEGVSIKAAIFDAERGQPFASVPGDTKSLSSVGSSDKVGV
jgi:hypothetical protein